MTTASLMVTGSLSVAESVGDSREHWQFSLSVPEPHQPFVRAVPPPLRKTTLPLQHSASSIERREHFGKNIGVYTSRHHFLGAVGLVKPLMKHTDEITCWPITRFIL